MALNAVEQRYWRRYLETLPLGGSSQEPSVTAGCAGTPEITDELARLYLEGRKTAGSSLLEDFLAADDPVPKAGDHWILLASDGEPRCILRTIRVETHPLRDVPDTIAVAEGEGDLTVVHWKQVHADRYGPRLGEWGLADIEEATVVTEFFEVVFR